MDLIGQLPRLAAPLLGSRGTAMTYQVMRGISSSSYYHTVTPPSITVIARSTRLNSSLSKQVESSWPYYGSNGYTRTRQCAFSQSTTTPANSSSRISGRDPRVSGRDTRAPKPHYHHRGHYKPRGAGRPPLSTFPLSRSFSSSSRVSCSAIISSTSIMADRDILPATVKPSHYDLTISSMNFDDWSYQGEVS
jgi:hypothetical protein